jgi:hypothetical protein
MHVVLSFVDKRDHKKAWVLRVMIRTRGSGVFVAWVVGMVILFGLWNPDGGAAAPRSGHRLDLGTTARRSEGASTANRKLEAQDASGGNMDASTDSDDGDSFAAVMGTVFSPDAAKSQCKVSIVADQTAVDSSGRLCNPLRLHPRTHCCPDRTEDGGSVSTSVCLGCDGERRCCTRHSACVSCCVGPANAAERAAGYANRATVVAGATLTASDDAFAYCVARCRHSSFSVVNGNRYNAQQHHCFGKNVDS